VITAFVDDGTPLDELPDETPLTAVVTGRPDAELPRTEAGGIDADRELCGPEDGPGRSPGDACTLSSRINADTPRVVAMLRPADAAPASTASAKAAAVGYLSAASSMSARIHASLSLSGTDGLTSRGDFHARSMICVIIDSSLSCRIIRCPVSISQNSTPAA
jgi:hypothetical protein